MSSENSKKNLYFYSFVTFYDFLSMKIDVNVPSETNKQKKIEKKLSFVDVSKGTDEKSRLRSQRYETGSVPICHGSGTLASTVP